MIFTDCVGSSGSFINESHAGCWFNGVYPNGIVHWFQGDADLTKSASTQEDEDQHRQYNIISTINVQKGNLDQLYNCSLWIPDARKYLSSELIVGKTVRSSGSIVKLHICMMVEIMMVRFMM